MGRPTKTGVDYFPLNVDLDIKLKLIKAEFGILGFGIVIRLYQNIYSENGYYMEWSQDVALMFADNERVGVNVVSEVVTACLKRGIFDKQKYDQYGILTSRGIQERYLEITYRRIESKILDEYAVLNVHKKTVNDDINGINDSENAVNDDGKYTKESKVNKSKVNKKNISPNRHKYGEFGHVLLTDEQFQKLSEEYPNYNELIKFLDEYIEMKGYKAKNHYLVIKKWVVNAVEERQRKSQRNDREELPF